MLISKIIINNKIKETILYDSPLLKYGLYEVHYEDYYHMEVPWHWHDEIEIIYVSHGSCIYRTSEKSYTLSAGDAVYCKPGTLHKLRPIKLGTVTFASHFVPEFLIGAGNEIDQKYMQTMLAPDVEKTASLLQSEPDDKKSLDLLREINDLCQNPPPYYEIDLREKVTEVWKRFFSKVMSSGLTHSDDTIRKTEDDKRMKKMLLFIEHNYNIPLDTEKLASSANISKRECYCLFAKQIGTSPAEFLKSYRIQCAKTLLLTKADTPITQIAMDCGFSSASYFTQLFKATVGITPRQFRTGAIKSNIGSRLE